MAQNPDLFERGNNWCFRYRTKDGKRPIAIVCPNDGPGALDKHARDRRKLEVMIELGLVAKARVSTSPIRVQDRRPLERGLLAVGREVRRRRIRVALFGAVEFADLAEVDLRETNLDLLMLLVVEFAVAQLALHG
jgi:hypothetical protein